MNKPQQVLPPPQLDGARVIEWAWSGERPFGMVADPTGEVAHEIYGLAIAQYDGQSLVYRFVCDCNWEVVQDADYASVEEAKTLLPAQYHAVPAGWSIFRPPQNA